MGILDTFTVDIDDLGSLALFDPTNVDHQRKAAMALNAAAKKARAWAKEEMLKDVAFPKAYLEGQESRLYVSKFATADSLESAVTGRARATSLARFSPDREIGLAKRSKAGVVLRVKPGRTTNIPHSWLIKLNRGEDQEGGFNIGLAMRLRPGETVKNKYKQVQMSKRNSKFKDIVLLYGPSVDQVFTDVSEKIRPRVSEFLVREFIRLVELKNV